jgi:hypothetical protein
MVIVIKDEVIEKKQYKAILNISVDLERLVSSDEWEKRSFRSSVREQIAERLVKELYPAAYEEVSKNLDLAGIRKGVEFALIKRTHGISEHGV